MAKHGSINEVMERCRWDPWQFAVTFLEDYIVDEKTGEPYGKAAFHDELYDLATDAVLLHGVFDKQVLGHKEGFAAAAPRGHGKSAIISLIMVLWAICFEHKRFIVIVSDTGDQAEKLGTNIRREFEENEVLRFYFGDMRGFRYDLKWTLKDFIVAKIDEKGKRRFTGRVMVSGTGSNLRGMRDRQFRPDLVIGDDLENDEHVDSEEMREWLYSVWWSKAILPMLDPRYGSVIVVGTILHFDSLLSRLLEDDDAYETRLWTCYKADGSSMWPERFPLDILRAKQRRDPVAFAQEYLNDPREQGTRAFRPESLKFYFGDQVRRNEHGVWQFSQDAEAGAVPLDAYVGVDPAISEEDAACDFAAIATGVSKDRWNILVLRSVITRLDFASQVKTIVSLGEFFSANAVGIEDQAYQKALEQRTREKIRRSIRVEPLKHGSGKVNKRRRIMALAPLVDDGRLWLRQARDDEPGHFDELNRVRVHEDHWRLYQQIVQYPYGKGDDGIDGLSSAVETSGSLPFFSPGTATGDPRRIPKSIKDKLARANVVERKAAA